MRNTRILECFMLSMVFMLAAASPAFATVGDQLHKLTATDGRPVDYFGISVSISNNTALVGAPSDVYGKAYLFDVTTGNQLHKLTPTDLAGYDDFGGAVAISGSMAIVGSDFDDDAGDASGSAYLFDVNTGNQLYKMTASDAAAGDYFGQSVGVSGPIAIVGADGDDDAGSLAGSAYLFDLNTHNEMFKLTAADATSGDRFGCAVAVNDSLAIVGARYDDDGGSNSGSAYLFNTNTGQQLYKLTADDATRNDYFGSSVAINDNVAIIGAYGNDDAGGGSGSAYLFDVNTGEQLFKLTASDAAAGDYFGTSVAIHGDIAVVGAYYDDDGGNASGSAYLFNVNTGEQIAKLTASDAAADDNFGKSVAVNSQTAIVGAFIDDDKGNLSGSAYLFEAVDCKARAAYGDFNCDANVGLLDLDILGQNWAAQSLDPAISHTLGDTNHDGVVGLLDLDTLGLNWRTTTPIPEPASGVLLALSGGLLLGRKH